jgi:D-tyrosyl-tRNA(Tyr) deacylase
MNGALYLADVKRRFREAQTQCDRAIAQVPLELWSHRLDPHAGQVVFLSKHLAGSQWQTLSVPRHGSAAFNASMAKRWPGV